MKYTHADIEADRHKPVGSLFMALMDLDSMPPRGHVHRQARGLYNRSLPNTALSLYPDEPARAHTPSSGRKHFPETATLPFSRQQSAPAAVGGGSVGVSHRHRPDHLGADMVPRQAEGTPVRQKRYLPEPRGGGVEGTPIRVRLAGGAGENGAAVENGGARSERARGSWRTPLRARARDHLDTHTLIPRLEPVKERPVPPPMIKTPRRTGIRVMPERRSASAADRRTGVKLVAPPPHWRSASDRQWDFLELGVSPHDVPRTKYRNQSSLGVGGGAPAAGKPRCASASSAGNGRTVTPTRRQRWRGRSSAANMQRRGYDIITGRPLPY